jgi:hypothetical protein
MEGEPGACTPVSHSHPKPDEILEEIILNIGAFKTVLFTIDGLRLLEVEVNKVVKLLTVEEFKAELQMTVEEALQQTVVQTTTNLKRAAALCSSSTKPVEYEVTAVSDFAIITTIVKAYALDQIQNYAKTHSQTVLDIKEHK